MFFFSLQAFVPDLLGCRPGRPVGDQVLLFHHLHGQSQLTFEMTPVKVLHHAVQCDSFLTAAGQRCGGEHLPDGAGAAEPESSPLRPQVGSHSFLSARPETRRQPDIFVFVPRSRCEFKIQAVNNQGRCVCFSFSASPGSRSYPVFVRYRIIPLTDTGSRFAIKTVCWDEPILAFFSPPLLRRVSRLCKASVSVRDVPDPQRRGEQLGSVVFSESFLESSINIQQEGKTLIRLSLITMDR